MSANQKVDVYREAQAALAEVGRIALRLAKDSGYRHRAAEELLSAMEPLGRGIDVIAPTVAAAPAPQQAVSLDRVIEWLRNNYQDHDNLAGLCAAMRYALSSSPAPAQVRLTDERVNALLDEWAEAGCYTWWAGTTDGRVRRDDLMQLVHAAAALAIQQQPAKGEGS